MFPDAVKFEPCGLAQMIALRYGTIPIVRGPAASKDTVHAFVDYAGTGNGFTFTKLQRARHAARYPRGLRRIPL